MISFFGGGGGGGGVRFNQTTTYSTYLDEQS